MIEVVIDYDHGCSYALLFFSGTQDELEKEWNKLSDLLEMSHKDEEILKIRTIKDFEECIIVSRMYDLIDKHVSTKIDEEMMYNRKVAVRIHANWLEDSYLRLKRGITIPLWQRRRMLVFA
ncbi:MAG: hypothetical protein WC906_03935 [Parcubacteria group bacterium]|jgi:hypothetical protein